MCGIVGYIGKQNALPILVEGLKRLLYRGYDSFGYGLIDNKRGISCFKKVGRLDQWEQKINEMNFEGKIGIGHCLPPDTLIQLVDGRIVEISRIKKEDRVLSLNPETFQFSSGEAKVFKHRSPQYIYEVKTPSTSFRATAEHRVMVFADSQIQEKMVKEISRDDLLIFPKKIKIEGKKIKFKDIFVKRYYEIPDEINLLIKNRLAQRKLSKAKAAFLSDESRNYLDDIARNDSNFQEDQIQKLLPFFSIRFFSGHFISQNTTHRKFIDLPKESSPELMQIIGYFLGDGILQPKTLRFKDSEKEVLGLYKKLIKKVFNLKGKIVSQKGTTPYLLKVNGAYLSDWFKENVVSRKEECLEEVGKLPEEEIAAFLKGIFDAEGITGIKSGQILLDITNKRIAQIIQFLLLRFGILSSLAILTRKEKNWSNIYRISLSNYDSIKKFIDNINFSSFRKKRKARLILKKTRRESRGSFKILPFPEYKIYNTLSQFVKKSDLRKFFGNGKNITNFITERKLNEFIRYLEKKYSCKPTVLNIINLLRKILEGDVVFQKVVEVKRIKSAYKYLYDLEITNHSNFIANCLLSHNSRWATHGEPTEANAHPHFDCQKNIFLVHNGIIENYKILKEKLIKEGHRFYSDTDTEVLAHLIEKFFKGNLEEATIKALNLIKGTYGLAIISRDDPEKLVVARNSSPILIGLGENEYIVASDPSAIIGITKKVIYLDDEEIAVLKPDNFLITDLKQNQKEKIIEEIEWGLEEAQKGGFTHFMLKEIFEAPEVIENAIRGRLIEKEGLAKLGGLDVIEDRLRNIENLIIIACGTSYFAGLVGEYMLEEYAFLPVEVEYGSEFRYKSPILNEKAAVLAISQSGETADTLASLREAKRKGVLTLGIVNVIGSTLAREVSAGIYNHAGPEIGVASTKTFISQLAILVLLTLFLGRQRQLSQVMGQRIAQELKEIPQKIKKILEKSSEIEKLVKKYQRYKNFLYLGRKYNLPTALEGALKLKEISYIHAEGYGGGEMKHGPIALIDENFPTLAICPQDSVYTKMISNIEEIKARKGKVIALTTEGNEKIRDLVDDVIYIPKTLEMLTPILAVIPLQLFAYYLSILLGRNPDFPRNLAKSCTTE